MADLIVTSPELITDTGRPLARRFVDNGDGTWSEKVNAGITSGTGASAAQSQGTAASGAAAVGNPVQQGYVYNDTQPTVSNGQMVAAQGDNRGNGKVFQATRNDPVNDSVTTYPFGHVPQVISTATTTTVKTGPGVVATIGVLGGTLGNVTVYDNTAASGTLIVPAVTPTQGQELATAVGFTTGLTIVTAAATLILVTYR